MTRAASILTLILLLGGCAYKNEPVPQIVGSCPAVMDKLTPPIAVKSPKPNPTSRVDVPSDWLVNPGIERKWEAIVVHHSATGNGNRDIFDSAHRNQNGWDGVGYDFVIGNGTDSGDGEVEVTFRWRGQLTGAHCKTPDNWANENAIGICLVGDFNQTRVSDAQMRSLVKLVRFLRERYGIPVSEIYGHYSAPGARGTECPGRNFPMSQFRAMLGR